MFDFTLAVPDKPGVLATIGRELGREGINIEGCVGYSSDGQSYGHLLFEDREAARRVIRHLGHRIVAEREVVVEKVEDRPGALGALLQPVADAGINLTTVYLATDSRIVLGADDLVALRKALKKATSAVR